jgi:hypothetical protein
MSKNLLAIAGRGRERLCRLPILLAGNFALIATLSFVHPARNAAAQQNAPCQQPCANLATAPAPAGQAHQLPPAKNFIEYWYGPDYRTPFVLKANSGSPADISRNTVEYKHLDFWSLGTNFVDLTFNQSGTVEPAASGGAGASEIYATLRSSLGLHRIVDSRQFAHGPLRDVDAEVGADLQTKNSAMAPAQRTLFVGPRLEWRMPQGSSLGVGLHLRKEWNYNGILGKAVEFNPGFNIEPAWNLHFRAGRLQMAEIGFAEFNTPKGRDGNGVQTVSEFLTRNFVSIDVGDSVFHRTESVKFNAGLWYWHNQYGEPSSEPVTGQLVPIFGIAVSLDGGKAHR